MAKNITLLGASYSNVPAVELPQTGGGTAKFTDTSPTTATDSDVASGKIYFKADGSQSTGTASGGGGGAVVVTDTTDAHGGTIREITAVDISSDTVTAAALLSGYTAHDNTGTAVSGSIATKTSSDLSASGDTVTVPAGYYASQTTKSVTSTTHPNPTVSVNSSTGLITASHTQTAGYVSAGTTTETEQLSVKSSSDLTKSGATVTAPAGYYPSAASASVASGSATAPASISGSSATVSTGTNTLTLSKTVSVTPSVTAGYVSSGTAGNSSVSLSASVTTKGAATIAPSTSDQTIASGTYLTGTQTIEAVTTTNLTAANIVSGVTVQVGSASDPDSVLSVTGTASGGTSWTLLHEEDISANTTGTSAASLKSITGITGAWDDSKIIYVRVRDKAGPRAGYFYGSDSFFINWQKANNSTTAPTTAGRIIHRYTTGNQWAQYVGATTTGYGVYGYDINNSGRVRIYQRYSSSYSLTINGTYRVQIYSLTYPDGKSPFNTGTITGTI